MPFLIKCLFFDQLYKRAFFAQLSVFQSAVSVTFSISRISYSISCMFFFFRSVVHVTLPRDFSATFPISCKRDFFDQLLKRVQHRLCPSRTAFFASSRHPAQRNVSIPIPPACTCQHAIDVNVTGRLVLKWIENTLHCFRTKGNIPEIRTWNPQWNVEGQNRTATWETSARGFSSWGLSVCSKSYKMLRNHLHHPVCSLCYWNSIFYIICSVQIKIQSRKKLWWEKNIKR